jgi:hypothetical protein
MTCISRVCQTVVVSNPLPCLLPGERGRADHHEACSSAVTVSIVLHIAGMSSLVPECYRIPAQQKSSA